MSKITVSLKTNGTILYLLFIKQPRVTTNGAHSQGLLPPVLFLLGMTLETFVFDNACMTLVRKSGRLRTCELLLCKTPYKRRKYRRTADIYKHQAIDIADPGSMQDVFVIDLTHRGVSVAQWLEHQSGESEGLRFDSSWGLRIFSSSHARDKTKKNLSLFLLVRSEHIWIVNLLEQLFMLL